MRVFANNGDTFELLSSANAIERRAPNGALVWRRDEFGTEPGQLNGPSNLYVSPTGELVVSNRGNSRIDIFDQNGTFLRSVGGRTLPGDDPMNLDFASDAAIDDQRIYVCDTVDHQIQVFSLDGSALGSFGSAGNGPGELNVPTAIVLGPADTLYVLDSGNRRIQVYERSGHFLRSLPDSGQADAALIQPSDIVVDCEGRCYVADAGRMEVAVFGSTGSKLDAIPVVFDDGVLGSPCRLEWREGELAVGAVKTTIRGS